MNSLGISEETKLVDANEKEIAIDDFQQGDTVSVTLKDSFYRRNTVLLSGCVRDKTY